jgi:hypothetical protein
MYITSCALAGAVIAAKGKASRMNLARMKNPDHPLMCKIYRGLPECKLNNIAQLAAVFGLLGCFQGFMI